MKNEHGIEMTEKDKLKLAMELLSDACCVLFECEEDNGKSAGFMADSLLKYLQVIHREDDPLDAACDYEQYEYKHYLKTNKNITVIK